MPRLLSDLWGPAPAAPPRRSAWADLLVVAGLAGTFFALRGVAAEWGAELRPAVSIDLSPWALPGYTLFSLARGLLAYLLSLAFTLLYGYWAARDRAAERVLVPLLDVLQSIPVLGFMPGLVLALLALFPRSNIGLELAAVLMIFSGQAWNMTFSFYRSLRSIPRDLEEAATVYRFSRWQRLRRLELPSAAIGLAWNSMVSMAGGWFFLMINEAFVLGDRDFRLPGVGSYMSVAVAHGDVPAMLRAIGAMVAMIVLLDQLLWRPVVVWAQKFRLGETDSGEPMTSWFLDWLRRSFLAGWLARLRSSLRRRRRPSPPRPPTPSPHRPRLSQLPLILFVGLLLYGGYGLFRLVHSLRFAAWGHVTAAGLVTLARVLASTALGTLWAVPAGLAIGLSPRLSRLLQPVVQVAASFPAPMLFPLVIAGLGAAGVPLSFGSILLMLLGTQWYILFNVIAGAEAIPADLREAAHAYRLTRGQRWKRVYLPAVFPHLVTGWLTAAGGAWNASIVAEYVSFRGKTMSAWGLGSVISHAAERADFPLLGAGVLVMACLVVLFNRFVWRGLYRVAEERFSLGR